MGRRRRAWSLRCPAAAQARRRHGAARHPRRRRRGPPPAGSPEPVGPPPTLLGHRDVTPGNTVFRDGVAVALIDFDLVRPSSRVDEVVNLLLWWAGWQAPEDRNQVFDGVDVAAHARALVDAYGLDAADRAWLVPVSISVADRSWFSMRDRAERLGAAGPGCGTTVWATRSAAVGLAQGLGRPARRGPLIPRIRSHPHPRP
ncbi:phosphotransferase [Tessaracoccus coleopterorum]|uniref:phosphotransferase n=1 Tax=Tessaracoccus coleopterorum TaxID=2714950 RepID=UPI001E350018|nr:phosphotransferase [Tessaracoccus coleopterorum]